MEVDWKLAELLSWKICDQWHKVQLEASTLEVSAGASPVINVFTNGGTECTLHVFTDDTKLGGVVDKPDICAAIQGDVDKLEKAGKQEHHGEKKCEVLQLGKTPCSTAHWELTS